MSTGTNDFMAGDTLSVLRVDIVDSVTKQTVLLDTLFTAQLTWKIDSGASVSKAMNVLTAPDDGTVEYQFTIGELTAGIMLAQVQLTEIATGKIVTTINQIKKTIGGLL